MKIWAIFGLFLARKSLATTSNPDEAFKHGGYLLLKKRLFPLARSTRNMASSEVQTGNSSQQISEGNIQSFPGAIWTPGRGGKSEKKPSSNHITPCFCHQPIAASSPIEILELLLFSDGE